MNLKQEADKWFSLYMRLRNATEDGFVICFTCGKIYHYQDTDCGHFISRGNLANRYNERNCKVQCVSCNRFKNGNIKVFEQQLEKKYGKEILAELNNNKKVLKRYTKEDYQEIIDIYKSKVKELLNEIN